MDRRAIEIEDEDGPAPKTALGRYEHALGIGLREAGRIHEEELLEARARAGKHGIRLTTALHELGLVDEAPLRAAACEVLHTRPVLPDDVLTGARSLGAPFDADELVDLRVIPFARKGETLFIATAEPWRLSLLDDLAARIGCRAELRFLDEGPLALCLEALYEHPADPRFKQPVRRRRRRAVASGPASGPKGARPNGAGRPEPEGDLMSESTFDDLYQR